MPRPKRTPTAASKPKSPYLTDRTCRDCRKANDEGNGYIGCWRTGQNGAYYKKHIPHHACGQLVPHDLWGFNNQKKEIKND